MPGVRARRSPSGGLSPASGRTALSKGRWACVEREESTERIAASARAVCPEPRFWGQTPSAGLGLWPVDEEHGSLQTPQPGALPLLIQLLPNRKSGVIARSYYPRNREE